MKREEEINLLCKHLAKVWNAGANRNLEALFEQAVQWADEHPKNPWRSPKVELPNEGEIVLTKILNTIDGGGEHNESEMIQVQKYIGRWITDRAEQHRMSGILFDTISKVTAWMPIPQVPKGGEG